MFFRTDMAVERRDLYKNANKLENEIDGIECEEEKKGDITITRVKITNENGEKALEKKQGSYITIDIKKINNITTEKEEEIIKKDTVYSKEQALLETSRIANEKLRQKIGEEDKILYEKSLKIMEEDSKIVVVIFFKVKEDITDYQPIKEEPQQELDEES